MSQFAVFDVSVGGNQTANGITAPAVVNPRRCILFTVNVVAPGTAGVLTINDAASLDDADDSNIIFTRDFSLLTGGQLIRSRGPCRTASSCRPCPRAPCSTLLTPTATARRVRYRVADPRRATRERRGLRPLCGTQLPHTGKILPRKIEVVASCAAKH
jgi:hypothetical protein